MAKYCYRCGTPTEKNKYCITCDTDTSPPRDVYFTEEECGCCDANLPRWSNFCPNCGFKFGRYDPTTKENKDKHNKGIIKGSLFFTVVAVAVAIILSIVEESIRLKYSLIGAAIFSALIWLLVIVRWERGEFIDGTVVKHYSEERTRREKDEDNKNLMGKQLYIEIPYTLYCTVIKYDDGTEDVKTLENTAADHIQLKIGDRIRFFKATRTYLKL